ncbi:MAG: hypothetical protein ABIR24_09840 [Verrucomicrobiota bacterium]
MNLMKLLTVGQSEKESKIVLGKFKLRQRLLPKFASTVRPSSSAVMETSVPSIKPAALLLDVSGKPNASAESKTIEHQTMSSPRTMDKTQKIPSGKTLRRIEEPAAIPRVSGFLVGFVSFLKNKFTSLKKKLFPVRLKNKFSSAPVQTEWSLEKVTVLRNDLNEADLEIVAPKPPVAVQPTKPNLVHLNRVKNSGREWIKMTTRLFKTSSPFESDSLEKHNAISQSHVPQAELAGRI